MVDCSQSISLSSAVISLSVERQPPQSYKCKIATLCGKNWSQRNESFEKKTFPSQTEEPCPKYQVLMCLLHIIVQSKPQHYILILFDVFARATEKIIHLRKQNKDGGFSKRISDDEHIPST